jgi:hypothetical protein
VGICGSGPQGTFYEWSYLIQTPFVSTDLKNQVNAECGWTAAAANEKGALSLKCVKLLNEASAQISNVNMYNVYGDWYVLLESVPAPILTPLNISYNTITYYHNVLNHTLSTLYIRIPFILYLIPYTLYFVPYTYAYVA